MNLGCLKVSNEFDWSMVYDFVHLLNDGPRTKESVYRSDSTNETWYIFESSCFEVECEDYAVPNYRLTKDFRIKVEDESE